MAIDELLDEHSQGVIVQKWLRKNGPGLLLGLVIGLGLLGGWSWYQGHEQRTGKLDAGRYSEAITAIDANAATAKPKVDAIESDSYRNLARLHLAKVQVEKCDTAAAIATLNSVDASDEQIANLVAVRLGRLHIESGKPAEAIKLLAGKETPEALEVLGDAYFAESKLDDARKAYQQALGKLDAASSQRPIVELKLTEAGGVPPAQPEAKS